MYFNILEGKGRDLVVFFSFLSNLKMMILSNLSYTLIPGSLLIVVPAALCGCSEEVHTPEVQSSNHLTYSNHLIHYHEGEDSALDIFAFEDDIFRKLDSYQRYENLEDGATAISSTGGNKIFFMCMNTGRKRHEWSEIRSYNSLKSILCNLENETAERRALTGELYGKAGSEYAAAALEPLACEVELESVGCDFSGTPYAEYSLEDVRAYLINVSASCPVLYSDEHKPVRYINMGMLNEGDTRNFKDQSILVRNISDAIRSETLRTDAVFLCYPNRPAEDSPGSPRTRLVIEGRIGLQTYYWPITVNGADGIERGCRYAYDILIRRKGVTDPDTPVEPANIEINMRIKPWEEKKGYSVGF